MTSTHMYVYNIPSKKMFSTYCMYLELDMEHECGKSYK